MAEVLSPPMQPTSTITMLHSRPSSADAFSASGQQYTQPQRLGQAPRGMYHGQNNTYRGAAAPVQPYAFQTTPHLRHDSRSKSAPVTSQGPFANHKPSASTSTSSSESTSQPSAKDDSVMGSRPTSLINWSPQLPDLSFSISGFDQPVKASPDRYRRPAQKRTDSDNVAVKAPSPQIGTLGSGTAIAAPPVQQPQPIERQASVDDMSLPKTSQSELAKRYRRRSLNQLDTHVVANSEAAQAATVGQRPSSGHGATSTPTTIRPVPFEPKTGPSATTSETRQNDRSAEVGKPAATTAAAPRPEQKVSVPARGSSDVTKRLAAPSPLSRQASDSDSVPASMATSSPKPRTYAAVAQAAVATPSPAAAQLAAVSDRDLNKGMKSKLRRAFSFSSAHELRKTAGENNQAALQQAQQAKQQHRQQIDDELDAEQLEIARRQEAAGIGAGIYSGQGGFSGSTDNLSISSTASSASMMLRKMGRGAKKGARSIKGLFRPKSVIGVPAADGPIDVGSGAIVQPSVAQVSMVTVEAERQNVNVNAHAEEMTAGGGTGFPKLERNSLDAATAGAVPDTRGSADGSLDSARRSVVGSDKDRAEVLAAVKKGILKRSGTGSPSGSPNVKPNDAGLTPVPNITESPASSLPGTPKEASPGRSASAPNVNSDYFSARILAKSMPNTPNGSVRSISFSPRIQFHDAWSSTDYDRRGDIATCNRLTPMLAQQIKEELNTFKMEMEVHEMSKPHTHFF